MKYSYSLDGKIIGHIDYSPKNNNIIYINLVLIYDWYRGSDHSTKMFNDFLNFIIDDNVKYNKIQLLAMEDMERYNKLYKLYESWGFKNIGKESIYSDNRGTFRRSLFEMIIPNTALSV